MKNIAKTASQIFTGAATLCTLCAGKVMAISVRDGINAVKTEEMPTDLTGANGVFSTVTHYILFFVGAISVIMLIIGGLRYALSAGDSKKVTDAKNTILYALIGLAIAILSYAIVDFVFGIVSK
ncbi:hypothetical protein IJG20_01705 [Candidatus Saccharibacteria bacterium]|nr:hypothetical protein [Candidatus Saccharibacteria bacterium]